MSDSNYWIIRQFTKYRFLCNLKGLLKSNCQQYKNKSVWRQHKDREKNIEWETCQEWRWHVVYSCLGDAEDVLRKLTVTKLVKKFRAFCGTKEFKHAQKNQQLDLILN